MDEWNIEKTNIPKDNSICDVILGYEKERGLQLTCAVIKNGRFMFDDEDVTDKVLKWHKLPNIILDLNGYFQWDEQN